MRVPSTARPGPHADQNAARRGFGGHAVTWLRPLAVAAVLIGLWQAVTLLFAPPPYILPSPVRVAAALWNQAGFLAANAATTALEIVLGLAAGALLGGMTAIAMAAVPGLRRALLPAIVALQALPVFAIAPLLVIWFGFGLASKVVMAALVIFFPVASSFHDGLVRADPALVDLARLAGAGPVRTMALIRLPAALPEFVSGMRVAAAIAPIGAVIGEWVGASSGLGFVMLHANARMQTDLMFAALVVLAVMAIGLRAVVDRVGRRMVPWVES